MSGKHVKQVSFWMGIIGAAVGLLLTGCVPVAPDELAVDATAVPATGVGETAVTLGATATGGVGPYTYAWTVSPSVTITDNDQASASATLLAAGVYTFTVTATDATGETATDTASVTITDPPPPTADAGDDKAVTLGSAITLDGSASSGKPPYTFFWQQIDGPGQTLSAETKAEATVVGIAVGASTFQLTVTDSLGATGTDTVVVTVSPEPGDATTFTIAKDTLTGTTGVDTFDGSMFYNTAANAWLMTVGNTDSADGLAGADIAEIELDEGQNINPTLANIETVDILVTNYIDGGAAAATFNASKTTGMTDLAIEHNVAALTVSNLDVIPDLDLVNMGADLTLTFDATAVVGAADTLDITLTDVTAGTLTLPETIEALTIASGGSVANVLTDIVDATSADDATGLGTITITGSQDLSIAAGGALDASVDTIVASALTGDLTVIFGNAVSDDIAFTGGSGDDDVTMATAADAVAATLGAGDDRITLGGFTDGTDSVDGGLGTDTLVSTTAVFTGVGAALDDLDAVEQLELSNGINGTINLSYFGSISQVELTAAIGGNSALTGATSGLTVVVGADDAGASTFGVTVSGTGTSDALVINLENGGTAFGGLTTLTGIESLALDSTTGANTLTSLTFVPSAGVSAAAVTITGDENLTLGTVTAGTPINATALDGDLSLTLGQAGSVTGGVGDDTLVGSATVDQITGGEGDDALDGNAGNDVISGGAGADTIDGGAGSDSIDLGSDSDVDTVDFSQVTGLDTITNFDAADEDILDIEENTIDGGEVEVTAAAAQGAATNDRTYVIEQTVGTAAALTTGGSETIADFTDVADVAAYLGERFTNSGVGAFCVVLNDGTDSYVYVVTDGGADAALTGEVVHIGTIDGAVLESDDVTQN